MVIHTPPKARERLRQAIRDQLEFVDPANLSGAAYMQYDPGDPDDPNDEDDPDPNGFDSPGGPRGREGFDGPRDIKHLFTLLHEVLDGLNDLDLGVVPEIFEPCPPAHKGADPVEVRAIRLRAVSYVNALRKIKSEGKPKNETKKKPKNELKEKPKPKYSLDEAEAMVSEAFGFKDGTVGSWRNEFLEESENAESFPSHQLALADLAGLHKFAMLKESPSATEARILAAAKRDGLLLKKIPKKKSKKSTKMAKPNIKGT